MNNDEFCFKRPIVNSDTLDFRILITVPSPLGFISPQSPTTHAYTYLRYTSMTRILQSRNKNQ